MKKLVFSISLILSYTFMAIAGVVNSIPAKADEFTNGNIITVTPSISETDLNTYNNALQVLEYLRQGGSIDFSNVSNNYTSGDLLDEFVDLIDTVGSGIDYYGNNFLNNIFDLSSDTVQLSPNTKLKDRIGQFRSNLPSYLNSQSIEPQPNPDVNYQIFIDFMNKRSSNHEIQSFWFFDNSQEIVWTGNSRFRYRMNYYPWSSYSYYVPYGNTTDFNKNSYGVQGVCCSNIISIYINSTGNGQYETNISTSFLTNTIRFYNALTDVTNTLSDGIAFLGIDNFATASASSSSYHFTGTLENIFNNLIKYFKNVNIYVDNVPWAIVNSSVSYSIGLNTGTYLIETNQPIEYKFDIPVYVDISDLIDKIQLAIDNKITLDFPYLNDLIVDTNGQQTIAVTVFSEDYTIDDLYVQDYGAMIPLFPLWVEYPVALEHINTVATVGIVDVIPADIIEVLGIFLIVGLFVFLCHRLME